MTKNCSHCKEAFEITEADLVFYDKVSPELGGKKISLPSPTHCPDCRMQRRYAWRNENRFYNNKCGLCGKDIISVYSPDKPIMVYCNRCWWSDKWDPFSYGQAYDPSSSFFDQFLELERQVPRLAMMNDNGVASENCEYTQDFAFGKNCYLVTGSWHVRDSFYSDTICDESTDVSDSMFCYACELVYECLHSQKLYNCRHMLRSEGCVDCSFGIDMKGCKDCFACFGLREKRFHILNEPHTEAEYRKKMAAFDSGSYAQVEEYKKRFHGWSMAFPRRSATVVNSENCDGDNIFFSRDCAGMDIYRSEGCRYVTRAERGQFGYDIHQSGNYQWCLECITPDNSYQTLFSLWCWKCKYVLYGDNCHSSEYCFGCTALKRGKYCILNKQYTKEEYEVLVPKIIAGMQKRGEWGELPPMERSYFGYDESLAQYYFPLSDKEAKAGGLPYKGEDVRQFKPQTYVIPDNITDTPDAIVQELLACFNCSRNYRIIPSELALYRKMRIPVPRQCFLCRHENRLRLINQRPMQDRQCGKCGRAIRTSYPTDNPYKIYCEACYLKEVY